jgi:hypothetical protein
MGVDPEDLVSDNNFKSMVFDDVTSWPLGVHLKTTWAFRVRDVALARN